MKIAIIGAGNVGKALGGTLVKAGHSVSYSTRNAASSIAAAQATGGTAAGSIREAVQEAAEEFARWIPGARVVKAFNTIFASVQGNPRAHTQELDAFFATDNDRVRDTTAELIRSIGFRPVYVGPLARARELEAIASLNIQMQMSGGGDWRSAFVLIGAPKALVGTLDKAAASTATR